MDGLQRSKIQDKFYTLITNTTCSTEFLLTFKSQRIFRHEDIKAIMAIGEDSLPMDQAYQFYRRILQKQGNSKVFDLLLSALKSTKQQVSYDALTSTSVEVRQSRDEAPASSSGIGVPSIPNTTLPSLHYINMVKEGENFKGPSETVKDFLSSTKENVLLLKCQNVNVSMSRIKDTMESVDIIDNDILKYFKPGKLFVTSVDEEGKIQEKIENLDVDKRKVIILHKQKMPLYLGPTISEFRTGTDFLNWQDLTPSHKRKFIQRLEKISGLELDVDLIFGIIKGNALTQLIATDTCLKSSFLGEMIKNCQTGVMEYTHVVDEEDLLRVAVKTCYPLWQRRMFPVRDRYQNEPALRALVPNTLVESNGKYEFSNEYLALYHIAKCTLSPGRTPPEFSKFLFGLEESSVDMGRQQMKVSNFQNMMVVYFIDFLITEQNTIISNLSNLNSIVTACIISKFTNLLNMVVPKVRVTAEQFMLSIQTGHVETAQLVYQEYLDTGGSFFDVIFDNVTFLHKAVEVGNVELTKKLLLDRGFIDELLRPHMNNLVHFCVTGSRHLVDEEVARKCEILTLLFNAESNLVDKIWDKNLPLTCAEVHLNIVKHLINLGANVNLIDGSGYNLLHSVALYYTPEEFDDLVKFLVRERHTALFEVKTPETDFAFPKYTPLCIALYSMEVKEETLKFLSKTGILSNSKLSALFLFALLGGRSNEYLLMLIENGVNINAQTINGSTMLHYVIANASRCSERSVKVLLQLGAQVNTRDDMKKTPLWYALNGKEKEHVSLETIRLLKEHGAVSKNLRVHPRRRTRRYGKDLCIVNPNFVYVSEEDEG